MYNLKRPTEVLNRLSKMMKEADHVIRRVKEDKALRGENEPSHIVPGDIPPIRPSLEFTKR